MDEVRGTHLDRTTALTCRVPPVRWCEAVNTPEVAEEATGSPNLMLAMKIEETPTPLPPPFFTFSMQ